MKNRWQVNQSMRAMVKSNVALHREVSGTKMRLNKSLTTRIFVP